MPSDKRTFIATYLERHMNEDDLAFCKKAVTHGIGMMLKHTDDIYNGQEGHSALAEALLVIPALDKQNWWSILWENTSGAFVLACIDHSATMMNHRLKDMLTAAEFAYDSVYKTGGVQ